MRGDLESGGSWASVPQPQARQTTANGQGPPPGQVQASRRAGGLQAGRWRPGTGRGWAAPVLTAALRGCCPRGSRQAVCSPGLRVPPCTRLWWHVSGPWWPRSHSVLPGPGVVSSMDSGPSALVLSPRSLSQWTLGELGLSPFLLHPQRPEPEEPVD